MLIVMYVAVIFSKTRNKKRQQQQKMRMTAEIEKIDDGLQLERREIYFL